ncbi:UNVERIFIED_CONTAM: hypothetical protein GTU68_067001, partial [Idotea baltica]|nr:hypothetical protein [Idotea baltica]
VNRSIIIGSRGSQLALWQANKVKDKLEQLGLKIQIKIIKTQGDQVQHLGFDKLEGKGFFTKEIETSLLNNSIDIAVHSYKDLPTENTPGLIISANSTRANPFDWIAINPNRRKPAALFELPLGATIGTSSPRRAQQLGTWRPDLKIVPIRGNVPTRLAKANSEVDAVVLAAAGLERLQLDLSNHAIFKCMPWHMVPAAAQGVLAYQCRADDAQIQSILAKIHDANAATSIGIERTILNKLEGGCQQPIGVFANYKDKKFNLWCCARNSANKFKRIYRNGSNPKDLVQDMLQAIENPTAKRIFISRDKADAKHFIGAAREAGHQVVATSLIEFHPIDFQVDLDHIDWLFFSSPRAAQFFFDKYNANDIAHLKIAAIGPGTESALLKLGVEAEFCGEKNNTEKVAHDFLKVSEGMQVLFPQAKNSLQSIQKAIGDKIKATSISIYQNEPKKIVVPNDFDCYACTSPLNAKVVLENESKENKRWIAIGSQTAATIQELSPEKVHIAMRPNELAMLFLVD